MKDSLTRLDSYDSFISKLNEVKANIGDRIIPIIYADIKHFKYFNDTYGYQRGDSLLRRFAELVSENRDSYICGARVVSDNIVTAGYIDGMTKTELTDYIINATERIEKILRAEYNCNRIRLAVGVYFLTKENNDIDAETAVSNANLARKHAKSLRGESVAVFRSEMADKINMELEIISCIEEALENHEFQAYYQPKIDSATGEISGAEALVRWRKPDGRFIFPDQFIPAIEKSGQIIDVDYYMYNEVFFMIRSKLDRGERVVPISMNVSRQHLKRLGIIEYIEGLLKRYKVPTKYLEFELTETICMEDTGKSIKFIEAMHKLGIKVSMDDFGSGYSCLKLLGSIPIDTIKIDKGFLSTTGVTSKEKVILANIINMTKDLDVESLCEGVETAEQSEFLTSAGCNVQQGYLFSKPVPQSEFERILIG